MKIQPLEPPDAHHLSGAVGWMELGNLAEAEAELDQISGANQRHANVLEVRWLVSAQAQAWERALEAARALIEVAPKLVSGWLHQAYALRRVPGGGLQQAWEALLPAARGFPKDPIVAYNLSCYACQAGRLEDARTWFKRALALGGKDHIKEMALADPDLEPLWEEIRKV